jgi:chorismate synthase
VDAKSKDYSEIKDRYRPGHADYSYDQKYGIRDYRGGGRSSARETAMRVAAGAIARKILGTDVTIRAAMVQMGEHTIQRDQWDWQQVQANPFFSPDASSVPLWEDYLTTIRKEGSSVGAVIEVVAEGIPVGLGEPTYKKLDAEIAAALMGIHAVKGVEIGDGFTAATLRGEENADAMRMEGNEVTFTSNHAGGVMGGISTGQPIVARFAVKPTSSLLIPVDSVTQDGREVQVQTKGRHDPCVGIRAVPVGEAMMACVLADHLLMHRARKA